MQKNILLRVAARALLVGMQRVPVIGGIIEIGRECWPMLCDAQEQAAENERIAQLEQAAACTADEARQVAITTIAELRQQGQVVTPELAAAVEDVVSVMPSTIRERTHATLQQARRLGTAAVTVLPVTGQFTTTQREAFYNGLFPTRRPQFRPGMDLPNYNGEWQLEQLLGIGGFGEVWLARHRRMKSRLPMAIKFCQDEVSAKLLHGEAERLDELSAKLPVGTAHVVALLDLQLSTMPYWLAMEYVEGGTLESRMRLGPMSWQVAWEIFIRLLQGMAQVHKLNIVHRDLKPANILLAGGTVPRIADFGIGKILVERDAATQRATNTVTTRGTGTWGYMSPEQAAGEVGHPSDDVYALGVILWQMLSGELRPLNFPAHVNKLTAPTKIKKVIMVCVFMPREERPANAQQLLAQLLSSVGQVKTTQPPVPELIEGVVKPELVVVKPELAVVKSTIPLTPIMGQVQSQTQSQGQSQSQTQGQSQSQSQGQSQTQSQGQLQTQSQRQSQSQSQGQSQTQSQRQSQSQSQGQAQTQSAPTANYNMRGHPTPHLMLPAVEYIHGWSTAKVQDLQARTAQALGLPVEYQHDLKSGGKGPVMVVIPAGKFSMGGKYNDEQPVHEVTMPKPFAIGKFAITFADYDWFCAATERRKPADEGWGRYRRPVIHVTWADAVAYCVWLSKQTGHTYRLPSEAEWEYACRAGTTTAYSFGDDENKLGDYAWFYGNAGKQTHPVGEKQPNPWGLYDMHGNVWEWCQDKWHDNYSGAPTDGSAWKAGHSKSHLMRGGSWGISPVYCRAAFRDYYDASNDNDGFRVVLFL